jgi:hypothetical protein
MFGFLSNLGSGLARLRSAFGHGAASIGKGIGRGVDRLSQIASGEDLETSSPYGTPPFNPNAAYPSQRGVRGLEDAVAAAENDAREDFGANPYAAKPAPILDGDLPNLPIARGNLPIPAPIPTPGAAPSFSGLNREPVTLPNPPVARNPVPTPAGASVVTAMKAPGAEMDLDRRNVPIPRLPGEKGSPIPYNPIDAAKYESVMSHAKRDAEGNLTHGFNRDWKTIAQNVLRGASAAASSARPGEDLLARAIGGGAAAGVGSTINPEAGYEFGFDTGQRPKMESEMARAKAERAAAMDEAIKQGQVDRIPIDAEREKAQTDQIRSQIEIGRQNADRQKMLTDAQADYYRAKAEAARTGNPKVTDRVNLTTGEIERVQVFPDGHEQVVGGSAAAAINQSNIQSRKEIAAGHDQTSLQRTAAAQGGANARNTATIAGAKERTQMNIDARQNAQGAQGGSKLHKPSSGLANQNGQKVTADQLQRYASSRNLTPDAARKKLKDLGYTVD